MKLIGTMLGTTVRDHLLGLGRLGLDVGALCESAEIDFASLARPGSRVALIQVQRIWETAEPLSGDPLIGLHTGEEIRPGDALGRLCLAQPDLERCLGKHHTYAALRIDALEVSIERRHDGALFRMPLSGSHPRLRSTWEEWAVQIVTAIAYGTGGRARLGDVRFPNPPGGPLAEYERVLGCPVRFDRPEFGFFVDAAALRTPMLTQNPEFAVEAEKEVRRLLALSRAGEVGPRVEAVLQAALAQGGESAPKVVAAQLGLSLRTLQRRMADEGTSFSEARDGVRRRHSFERLQEPGINAKQLAGELGFADITTFSKAFKRWTGMGLRNYRRGPST